jgi:hypothetical protein
MSSPTCGVLIYEKVDGRYVGECDCRLRFEAKNPDRLERDWQRHAGAFNPWVLREFELAAEAEAAGNGPASPPTGLAVS